MKDLFRHSAILVTMSVLSSVSVASGAGPEPAGDPAVQRMQLAEAEVRQARLEGDKKPPREVRKEDQDAKKGAKKGTGKGH